MMNFKTLTYKTKKDLNASFSSRAKNDSGKTEYGVTKDTDEAGYYELHVIYEVSETAIAKGYYDGVSEGEKAGWNSYPVGLLSDPDSLGYGIYEIEAEFASMN